MRQIVSCIVVFVLAAASFADDRQAVTDTINDYILGAYEADGERTYSSLHPQLAKRTVQHEFWGVERDWIEPMTSEELRILAGIYNLDGTHGDPATSRRDIEIYEISDTVATAKLTAQDWYDYFHLVKIDGEWSIINVLWGHIDSETGEAPAATKDDLTAIRGVGRQFVDGFYQAKPELVRGTLHPLLSKYSVRPGRAGIEELIPITYESLINNSTDWHNYVEVDPDTARFDYEIYDATVNSATVKLVGEVWFDYLHLAKLNGEWVILNCVWDSLGAMAGE